MLLYVIVLQVMKNDKSWRGMLIKDNEGDWGVAVAAWRGMKKGEPGVSGVIKKNIWILNKMIGDI